MYLAGDSETDYHNSGGTNYYNERGDELYAKAVDIIRGGNNKAIRSSLIAKMLASGMTLRDIKMAILKRNLGTEHKKLIQTPIPERRPDPAYFFQPTPNVGLNEHL